MNNQETEILPPKKNNQQPKKISKFKYQTFQANSCIQNLSYKLIRPPKIGYDPTLIQLPQNCTSYSYFVERIPFQLSLYLPKAQNTKQIILYLHGNASSRLEGWLILKFLPPNFGLACFDFEGCGNRQGNWITLGLKQSKQVDIAANFLKEKGYQVIGWGRSMGAVSLLMSTKCDIMIVDSPFACLKSLCFQAVKTVKNVPNCFIYCLFPFIYYCIRNDIMNKTDADIYNLEVWKVVQYIDINKAILFMSGDKDEMINSQHSKSLYDKFKGLKQLLIFQGTHNSNRSAQVYKKCFDFIRISLIRKQKIQQFHSLISLVDTKNMKSKELVA